MQVPKATQPRIKDAIARIRACLLAGSRNDLEAANKAVQTLINDPNIALDAGADSQQLRNQISTKFNSDLVDVFLKEMDQRDPAKLAYLVEFLSQLGTFLGPTAIVMEWWDGDGAARVLATRQAATYYRRSAGHLPPELTTKPKDDKD